MPDPIRLVALRETDLADILPIEREAFEDAWERDHFLHELRDNPFARCYRLAGPAEATLGYACVWIVDSEIWIINIAVAAAHRGRGLGKQLLGRLLDFGRACGCRQARLEVRPSNRAALALYRGAGFRVIAVRQGYYGGREDGWVMGRRLPERLENGRDGRVEGESSQ